VDVTNPCRWFLVRNYGQYATNVPVSSMASAVNRGPIHVLDLITGMALVLISCVSDSLHEN